MPPLGTATILLASSFRAEAGVAPSLISLVGATYWALPKRDPPPAGFLSPPNKLLEAFSTPVATAGIFYDGGAA